MHFPSSARSALFVLCLGFLALPASAQLVLTVDTTAETFTFSGSTTGTPTPGGMESPRAVWLIGSFSGTYAGDVTFTGFESDGGSVTYSNLYITDEPTYQVRLIFSSDSEQTLSGNSIAISYASKSASFKSTLSDLIGSSISLSEGSGFSSISVVSASAVPEPSTYAAIFGGLALAGAAWHRRRTAKRSATAP